MSGEFWLYPPGVVEQATGFTAYAELAGSSATWITGVDLTNSSQYPLYSRGATVAIEMREGLIEWFTHLEKVLSGVAAELNEVAAEGERIDLEQQAELDKVDPQTYVGYDQTYYGTGGLLPEDERLADSWPVFTPRPQGAPAYCDGGPGWQNLNNLTASIVPDDILSPSEWVWALLGFLGAQDLSDMVLKTFGGRWGDLYRFTDTLEGFGTIVEETYVNLGIAQGYLAYSWQGFAHDSADKYLTDLVEALTSAHSAITEAHRAFELYAKGIVQKAEAIAGLMFKLGDALIVAAAAGAFGTVTLETVVGAVGGYGTMAGALAFAAWKIYEIRGILQDVELAATAIEGLANGNTALIDFTTNIPVPEMVEAP